MREKERMRYLVIQEDAGGIYRAVCGQEIQRDGGIGGTLEPLQAQGALLKSSGYLSGERCGGVAEHPFALSAVGRCLRQPRHTPLIILPLNAQPLCACCLFVCVCVPAYISGRHKLSEARRSRV